MEGASGMSMTESWDLGSQGNSGAFGGGGATAVGDPFGGEAVNQETWSGRMPPQDPDAEQR